MKIEFLSWCWPKKVRVSEYGTYIILYYFIPINYTRRKPNSFVNHFTYVLKFMHVIFAAINCLLLYDNVIATSVIYGWFPLDRTDHQNRAFGRTKSTTPSNKHTWRMLYTPSEECEGFSCKCSFTFLHFLWLVWPASFDKRKAPYIFTKYYSPIHGTPVQIYTVSDSITNLDNII